MTSFLHACWQRRWFRRLTWTCVTLLTFTVLFYQWVNWSGARRWKAAEEMLRAQGESLDVHQIAPDPVPDERNFCAIPLLKNLPLGKGPEGEAAAVNRMKLDALGLPTERRQGIAPYPPKGMLGAATTGRPTDFKAWADWLRREGAVPKMPPDFSLPLPPDSGDAARDILTAMAKHDALMAQLTAGLSRQEAQWTPPWRTRELPDIYASIAIPHYSPTMRACQFLALRATAAAHAGDASRAHESALIILRFSQASLEDPFLIGTLMGIMQARQASDVVWELSREHSGSVEDFRRLEMEFRKIDIRSSFLRSYRAEMAGGASMVRWLKHATGTQVVSLIEGTPPRNATLGILSQLVPSGFYDMNAAAIVEFSHEYILAPLRDRGLVACLKRAPELDERFKADQEHLLFHLDIIFAKLTMATMSKITMRAASTQDIVSQAILACALERYYAMHHAYPDNLSELDLEGRPMPQDLFSGQPPHYRKTADGRYALWSVGFDGVDDGGKRGVDPKHPDHTKFYVTNYAGDWVWDFPE
jgi:hypothetical protein